MLLPRDYSKLIEYLSFFLQCATIFILGATAYYDYSLLKMAEAMTFNDFFSGGNLWSRCEVTKAHRVCPNQ